MLINLAGGRGGVVASGPTGENILAGAPKGVNSVNKL